MSQCSTSSNKRLAEVATIDLCATDQKRVRFAEQGLDSIKHAQKKAFRVANELGEMAENWTGLDLVKENKRLEEENMLWKMRCEHWEKKARDCEEFILKMTERFHAASADINEANGLTGSGATIDGAEAEALVLADDEDEACIDPPCAADSDVESVAESHYSARTRFTATTQAFKPVKVNKRVQGDFSVWEEWACENKTKLMVDDLISWLGMRKRNPFKSVEQARAFRAAYHQGSGSNKFYNNDQMLNEYFSKYFGKGPSSGALKKYKPHLTSVKNAFIQRLARERKRPESAINQVAYEAAACE